MIKKLTIAAIITVVALLGTFVSPEKSANAQVMYQAFIYSGEATVGGKPVFHDYATGSVR